MKPKPAREVQLRREANELWRRSQSDLRPGSGNCRNRRRVRAPLPAEVSSPLAQGRLPLLYTAWPFTPLDEATVGLPGRLSRESHSLCSSKTTPPTTSAKLATKLATL